MFKERPNVTPKVKYLAGAPVIWVSPLALAKMQYYVQGCADEIGWLGMVEDLGEAMFYISDTILFEQEVHGATCEITPDGLTKIAEEILQQDDGMEIYNSLRLWGHSHVHMGVSPSAQDDDQMKTFESCGHDWFLRVIANKKGEMEFAVYDFKRGIIFTDVQWSEWREQPKGLKDAIDAEIKEKVRKKTYATVNRGRTSARGTWVNGKWVEYADSKDYSPEWSRWQDDSDAYSFSASRGAELSEKGKKDDKGQGKVVSLQPGQSVSTITARPVLTPMQLNLYEELEDLCDMRLLEDIADADTRFVAEYMIEEALKELIEVLEEGGTKISDDDLDNVWYMVQHEVYGKYDIVK